jgi:hypothetical protein
MTGRSLMPMLLSKRSGQLNPVRTFVLTGMEKHVYACPTRAIRTDRFLYIRNFGPQQWPTGESAGKQPEFDFSNNPWPAQPDAFSFNIDPSPSKQFLRLNRNGPEIRPLAELSFGRRPEEELYELNEDPFQIRNVALVKQYSPTLESLRQKLDAELIKSDDPRLAVAGYQSKSIAGWPVRISEALIENAPDKTGHAIELLRSQLQQHDPLMHDLLIRLWKIESPEPGGEEPPRTSGLLEPASRIHRRLAG